MPRGSSLGQSLNEEEEGPGGARAVRDRRRRQCPGCPTPRGAGAPARS
jgi:hypothetical protein